MKKISILTILTAVTLMISSMTVAQAGTVGLRSIDLLQGSEDLKEMKSLLPDMQQWIADADLPDTKITEADLNNGYKVYTDFKLENSKDSSSESIQDSLEENPYIWEIPVKISDKTYTFTVGRSQPLSENGKQNLTAAEQKEIKNGMVLWPIRTALSGKPMTPCGATELLEVLGKEESLRRIDGAIEKLSNES